MLNGTPRNRSALRWYSWQESRPSATWNWKNAWHGASAMRSRSATFHADTMIRRESGSDRSWSRTRAIWSTWPPSGVGHDRHCTP